MMVISISAMKSSEVSKAFGINQPYVFPRRVLQKRINPGAVMFESNPFTKKSEELEETDLGVDATPEELGELKTFQEFLSRHIQPNAICDVQCMLLWAEWVRFYKKQTRKVPDLILEKEFRELILHQFDLTVNDDGFRGYIYPGIKYIP
jgi:hypothetical protein